MDGQTRKDSYMRIVAVSLFVILAVAGMAFSIYIIAVATTIYMVALGIFLLVLSTVSGLFNIFAAILYYRSYYYGTYIGRLRSKLKPMLKFPSVAVAMTVYNEDPNLVKKNFARLMKLKYRRNRVKYYLLDDSTKQEIRSDLESFCGSVGAIYMHRSDRKGFKAGNLNNMLRQCKEEFIAIFDYDEYLVNTDFLLDTIPFFQDERVGYVQTEKQNADGNFFSDSVKLFDGFFFKFIQPARALDNTAIFAGSCGVIRKKTLEDVGGFPEYVIEDTFFSFESDLHNYKGLYLPKVYAYGEPITTFTALVKQQWRYNYGDTQFILYFLRNKPKDIKRGSKLWSIDYLTHGFGLNYLSVMLLLFTLASIMIVFSNLPFTHLSIFQFADLGSMAFYLETVGAMAFVLSFMVPIILTKMYFKSTRKGIMIFVLNFALIIARTKAFISALLKIDPSGTWKRSMSMRRFDLLGAIRNTKYELSFSGVLFIFGYLAAVSNNISGGIWLLFYGLLYLCATVMAYAYG